MKNKIAQKQQPLTYYKACKGRFAWKRLPEKDIVSENGKILWYKYRCSQCRSTTICPSNKIKGEN